MYFEKISLRGQVSLGIMIPFLISWNVYNQKIMNYLYAFIGHSLSCFSFLLAEDPLPPKKNPQKTKKLGFVNFTDN